VWSCVAYNNFDVVRCSPMWSDAVISDNLRGHRFYLFIQCGLSLEPKM